MTNFSPYFVALSPVVEENRINCSDRPCDVELVAYERGRADGLAEAEKIVASIRVEDASKLAVERTNWIASQLRATDASVAKSVDEFQSELRQDIASILDGFLELAIIDRSLVELKSVIAGLIDENEGFLIEIVGPGELIANLRNQGCFDEKRVRFTPSEKDIEMTVKFGPTIVETSVSRWRKSLLSTNGVMCADER